MSKFLNETGLSHFWEKVKTYLSGNFLSLDGGNMNEGAKVTFSNRNGSTIIVGGDIVTSKSGTKSAGFSSDGISASNGNKSPYTKIINDGLRIFSTLDDSGSLSVNIDNDGIELDSDKTISIGKEYGEANSYATLNEDALTIRNKDLDTAVIVDSEQGVVVINSSNGKAAQISSEEGLYVRTANGLTNPTTTISPNGTISTNYIKNDKTKEETTIVGSSITAKSVDKNNAESYVQTTLAPGSVNSPKFVKQGGTASQVLMADGSIKTIGAKSGIATLDANGRIPLSQLGNLDTTLFQVVDALPTSGIVKNRIYLVKSTSTSTQNIYAEYIYTGDVSATYDASKWEKLGEYKSDVDLSSYSKKSETVSGITLDTTAQSESDGSKTVKLHYTVNGVTNNANCKIPVVTTALSGIMAASDKKALDTLTARYPLGISSFSASPNLVEVGVTADVTFSWDFTNTDFHPITSQSIVVDGAAAATVAVGTKSYKKTGLAGATTATNKSASITINGSLKKSVNITYHYPSYIGLVADGTTITEAVVKGLTKSIEWGKSKTKALNQSNQKIVYAYPASYGDLTSIKDGNGFQGFAGYAKQTLTVGGQSYNVYVQKLPATANSTYTFA